MGLQGVCEKCWFGQLQVKCGCEKLQVNNVVPVLESCSPLLDSGNAHGMLYNILSESCCLKMLSKSAMLPGKKGLYLSRWHRSGVSACVFLHLSVHYLV